MHLIGSFYIWLHYGIKNKKHFWEVKLSLGEKLVKYLLESICFVSFMNVVFFIYSALLKYSYPYFFHV